MFHSHPETWATEHPQRREFARIQILCRARIRIGNRQYAGYLHNISQGGAKLRTLTPIRRVGHVILRLPDLPALRCQLRWTDSYNAGVSFELKLPSKLLSDWARARSGFGDIDQVTEAEILALGNLAVD
jgi:hypothetical protein